MADESLPQTTSPDGAIRVEFGVNTGRMSHEIYSPRVLRLPQGEVLVDLWGTYWDATAHFDAPGTVGLYLRYYPGERRGFEVTVDARGRSFSFADSPARSHPLSDFKRLIEQKHQAQPSYAPAPQPPSRRRDIVAMLLIGLSVLGAFYLLVLFLSRP